MNEYFGIENEITIPIIVPLIVFIIGGASKVIINSINNFASRKQIRKSFNNIIVEIIGKCKNKANHLELFYPTLSIENNDDWVMKFTKVTYLQLAFQQDINSIYNSYRIHFKYKCNQNIKLKAYNKIWSYLENLRFYEGRILSDLENSIAKFNIHETEFYNHLESIREENDRLLQPLVGKNLEDLNLPKNFHYYVIERDKIFVGWQEIGEPTRRLKTIQYSKLVKPLHELNLSNQDIELTIPQNTMLLAALHEYEQMEKIMTISYKTFYEYYFVYKTSHKVLMKCLEIIK
jgi:hypothetical protein